MLKPLTQVLYCYILLHNTHYCMQRGYNIGVRLVEDYLARMPTQQRCHDMRETAQAISKVWKIYNVMYVRREVL